MPNHSQKKSTELSKRYSLQKHMLACIGIVIGIIYLVLMGLFGSNIIKHFILSMTTNQYLLIALYVLAFTVIIEIITIPLNFYGGFVLEHIYNLSNQKFSGWAKDELKKFLISLVLIITMIEIIYIFLRNFPNSWWIFIAIIWVLFSVIIAKLAPVLIFPLFYKSVPIENKEIKDSLQLLAEGTGINIKGVYKINLRIGISIIVNESLNFLILKENDACKDSFIIWH